MGNVTVPQNRSGMIEQSICYFKTRGERRATKGDKRGRLSRTLSGNAKRERR